MAHRAGDCFAEENSFAALESSLKTGVELIEFDVRKSTDGVLFCYHGSVLEFCFPRLLKKRFSVLRMQHPSIPTLDDVLSK